MPSPGGAPAAAVRITARSAAPPSGGQEATGPQKVRAVVRPPEIVAVTGTQRASVAAQRREVMALGLRTAPTGVPPPAVAAPGRRPIAMAPRPMAALVSGAGTMVAGTMVALTTATRPILMAQSPPVLPLAQRRAQPQPQPTRRPIITPRAAIIPTRPVTRPRTATWGMPFWTDRRRAERGRYYRRDPVCATPR